MVAHLRYLTHLEAKYVVAGFSPRLCRTRAKARDYILEFRIVPSCRTAYLWSTIYLC